MAQPTKQQATTSFVDDEAQRPGEDPATARLRITSEAWGVDVFKVTDDAIAERLVQPQARMYRVVER